jgi:3-phosphoshikimate 1-carboxyvinyltransferase
MLLRYNGQPINVAIDLPGSKSISNRVLILREVLSANTEFHNLSSSRDTLDLVKALHSIKEKNYKVIDVGPAGTSMRFLTAFLATQKGEWTLTGSERMKERPIKPLVEALNQIGAEICYKDKNGYPPLQITGHTLKGGDIEIDGSISSQFITAILLCAILFEKGTRIFLKNKIASWPYIKMTLELLKEFGIPATIDGNSITIANSPLKNYIVPQKYEVEADWSSASYWYSVAALSQDAVIKLNGLRKESLQGDSILPTLYEMLGVSSCFDNNTLVLKRNGNKVTELKYDFSDCPDIAQTVAVTCLGLGISCSLTGLSTLQHKETNRILALKNELEKFGASVSITENSLEFKPGDLSFKKPIEIATYKDHRMAMSFAPLVLVYPSLIIDDLNVVEKSYPSFWEHLGQAGITTN